MYISHSLGMMVRIYHLQILEECKLYSDLLL